MRKAGVTGNRSAGRSSRRRRFWEEHRDLIALVGVIATVAALVVAVWALRRDGGEPLTDTRTQPAAPQPAAPPRPPPPPPAIPAPKNVIEQIAQRDFWVRQPRVFESAKDALDFDTPGPAYDAAYGPVVLDARELADGAVSWEGETVYVVGKVVRQRSVEAIFDLDIEFQLAPVRGTTMYVGESYTLSLTLPVPVPDEGDVIYASGKLAAIGEAREPGSRAVPAVYFLAGDVGIYEPGKRQIDSRELEKRLAAAAKRR